jgi:hypothetical protein
MMVSDTPADVLELQAAMYRALPIDRKFAIIDSMYRGGRELSDLGFRLRNPDATPRECLENWIRLTVPDSLVLKALETAVDSPESATAEVRHLARKLSPLGIELVIGGSVAGSLYSNPRYTQDADVSVEPFIGREAEIVRHLDDEYVISLPAVRSAVQRRSTFNVLRKTTSFKIDIFIQGSRSFDRIARDRRRPLPAEYPGDTIVYVHSPEDIVLQKLAWYRLGNEVSDKQWADILGILRTQRGNLDEAHLTHWASELKVADLWQRAQAELSRPTAASEEPA